MYEYLIFTGMQPLFSTLFTSLYNIPANKSLCKIFIWACGGFISVKYIQFLSACSHCTLHCPLTFVHHYFCVLQQIQHYI